MPQQCALRMISGKTVLGQVLEATALRRPPVVAMDGQRAVSVGVEYRCTGRPGTKIAHAAPIANETTPVTLPCP